MRWSGVGMLAVLAGTSLFVLTRPRPTTGAAAEPGSEPAETAAWADPVEARLSRDLDDQREEIRRRSQDKAAIVQALLRGDLTFSQSAARFRAANAGAGKAYGLLPDLYPWAAEEELSFRQVVCYIRGLTRANSARAVALLPGLEADVARRFPGPISPAPAPRG
jgi:hypothetical protein